MRHAKWIRVVVMPHVVTHSSKRVAHGKATTVNGWLGHAERDGTRRADRARVDGAGQWARPVLAGSGRNDRRRWELERNASRRTLALSKPSTAELRRSSRAHRVRFSVVVPAKVELISVSPRRIAWGGTVRIVGKLDGGYLPPGGALVRLRLGQGSGYTTYGVQEHVTRQRPVCDDLHVRRRAPKRSSDVLVPDRVTADGRRLSLGSLRQPQGARDRWRPSATATSAASSASAPQSTPALSRRPSRRSVINHRTGDKPPGTTQELLAGVGDDAGYGRLRLIAVSGF